MLDALFQFGQGDDAAQGFLSSFEQTKGGYSVQLLVACSDETVQKAAAAVPAEELFILPVHYKGKDCYRIGWGVYDSESKAANGAKTVPAYFRDGGAKPKVVPLAEILR